MLRVFISSTSKDLTDYREAAMRAVSALDMHPVVMEDFNATDANAVDKCRQAVESCDILIGVYAYRYGYVPPDEQHSITEMEYEWATAAGKPRLIFVIDPAFNWTGIRDD